ncbi:MAG: hypothetical protein D6730_14655 [Bacteroidetes bacterium]|nr:MAG: hypothetical protein D6730_14655 [Bacteroidota bacterium]
MFKTCLCTALGCLWFLIGEGQILPPAPPAAISLGTELMPQRAEPLVKSRKSYLYEYTADSLLKSQLEVLSRYDAAGNESERIFYDAAGRQLRRLAFVYDSLGQLRSRLHFDRRDSLQYRVQYHYDARGHCLAEQHTALHAGAAPAWRLYRYNPAGQCVARLLYEGDTLRQSRKEVQRMEYDENGLLIRQDFCDHRGIIYQTFWYDYDPNGQEVGFQSLDPEGNLLAQKRTAYRENGKEEVSLDAQGRSITHVASTYHPLPGGGYEEHKVYLAQSFQLKSERFRYDSHGRLIEEERRLPGHPPQLKTYTYTPEGLLLEEKTYQNHALLKRRLYSYEFQR